MPKHSFEAGQISIKGSTAQEIARSLRENVEAGKLQPGAMVPPTRSVASALEVNRNTVAAAYKKLTQAGLIEPKGRGLQVAVPPVEDFSDQLEIPEGLKDVSFANPDPKMLPSLKAALKTLKFEHHLYGQNPDSPELLAAFDEWSGEFGLPRGEQIVCPGTVETLERLLAVYAEPRDQIIVEDPSYMKLLHVVRSLGLTPIGIPMDREGMQYDALKGAINDRTRVIILTPVAQNPTGITYSATRLAAISDLLDNYPEILIVEDEHYGAMARTKYRSTYKKGRKHWAILSSVAKYLGPDFRIAVLNGSLATVKRLKTRRAATGQWVSMILQELVTALLRDKKTRSKIKQGAKFYTARRNAINKQLLKSSMNLAVDDGFNLWVPTRNQDRFAHELARRGWLVRTDQELVLGTMPGVRLTFSSLSIEECNDLACAISTALVSMNDSSLK